MMQSTVDAINKLFGHLHQELRKPENANYTWNISYEEGGPVKLHLTELNSGEAPKRTIPELRDLKLYDDVDYREMPVIE